MSEPVIGYAGMTHLGLCSAVAAAERGFTTLGFDPDAGRIAALDAGKLPVVEPELRELLATNESRLRFTARASDLGACDIVYVAADVPTDNEGRSDLTGIEELLARVDAQLESDAVLVVLSQVPPGFTRRHGRPGRPLFYQVETLVFGRAMSRALHPERFIVGTEDRSRPLPSAWVRFLDSFRCPVLTMSLESAELAKIAINVVLVASIGAANTLAELCEALGADWSEIAPALRLDGRIGAHAYIEPGLGIAGGNLERDLATAIRLADLAGTDAALIRACVSNSQHRRDWALRTLHATVLRERPDPALTVLGLTYKQNTSSTKNSPALALIAALPPVALRVYDPVVGAEAVERRGVRAGASALDACYRADAVLILTPWAEFAELKPRALREVMRGRTLIDPFGILDGAASAACGLDYFTLGAAARVGPRN